MKITSVLLFALIAIKNFGQIPEKSLIDSILAVKGFKNTNPGVSVLVAKNGQIIYEKQFGLANVQKQIPITENTIFNIGSATKQFTAYCIFTLEEKGLLKTTDSIQKYLPELPNFGKTVTIDHLIAHTSGIPDHLEILGLTNNFTPKRLNAPYMMTMLKNAPYLSFNPGERFAYCNTGYMILWQIVERIAGMSIEKYANDNIFTPLGMKTAVFTINEEDGSTDGTTSYYLSKGKYKKHKPQQPNAMGATGVFCTLRDYLKWENQFLNPSSDLKNRIQKMTTSYRLNDASSAGYGGGIILKPYKGYLSEEHSGGWNSFLVQFRRIPDMDLTILVASNSINNNPFKICDEISDVFIDKNKTKPFISTENTPSPVSNFEGIYIDANNVVRRIRQSNKGLWITNYQDTTKSIQTLNFLSQKGDSLLRFVDGQNDTLDFHLKNDKIVGFYWVGGTYFRFKRYYEKLETDKPDNVESYRGTYTNKDYAYTLKIKSKNSLILKPVFFLQYPLIHLGSNVYKVKNEPIYFRFDKDCVSIGNEWVFNLPLYKVKNQEAKK